jgi:hypothetical protein
VSDTAEPPAAGSTPVDRAWRDRVAVCLDATGQKDATREWRCCGQIRAGVCPECNHYVRPMRYHCDVRICPECARRRSLAIYHRLLPAVAACLQSGRRGYRLRLITLTTIKPARVSAEYVKDAFDVLLGTPGKQGKLTTVWRSRLGSKRVLGKSGRMVSRKIDGAGALAGVETAPGGMVHLHILYWGPWVGKKRLRRYWRESTGGAYIVHVKELRMDQRQQLHHAIWEVCKYPIKGDAISPLFAAWTLAAMKGHRRARGYGAWHNLERDEEESEKSYCCHCWQFVHPTPTGKTVTAAELLEYEESGWKTGPADEDMPVHDTG